MKLLFVGTGAADYEAALSCPCHNCVEMRTFGGRNVRTYASILVDGWLLIDCGSTVPWKLAELGVSTSSVSHLLVTHSHLDHLDPDAVSVLAQARHKSGEILSVWGNNAVLADLQEIGEQVSIEPRLLHPNADYDVGSARVTTLLANHNLVAEQALNFVACLNGVNILYAADTAWPLDETWQNLQRFRIDAAIVEATFGPLCSGEHPELLTNHLNWATFRHLRDALTSASILKPDAPYVATHLSLHHLPVHARYTQEVGESGVVLAWDGMTLQW